MTYPKVSILVPVYNVEKYIRRCVVSLMEQTLEELEYIFVDDCGTDCSLQILREVIKEYPKRKNSIHIIRHENNRGSSAARNTALDLAKGEYIIFADSDDWMECHGAEAMYHFAKTHNLDIAYSRFYKDYPDGRQMTTCYQKCATVDECIRHTIQGHFNYVVWNKIYRRQFFIDSRVRNLEGCNNGEDMGMNIKLFPLAEKIAEYDGPPYYHYSDQTPGSYTSESRRFPLKNVPSVVANVDSAISFLKERDLYNQYENELMQVKINVRNLYLCLNKDCLNAWLSTYPETTSVMLQQVKKSRSLTYMLSFYLLCRGWITQYVVYVRFMDFLSKIIKRS